MSKVKSRSHNMALVFLLPLVMSGVAANSSLASTPIDTGAPFYLSSQLGISVLPDFRGGVLRIDQSAATYVQNFAVENYSTNTIDLRGNATILSGILSGAGPLRLVGDSTLTLTGQNTYSGGTFVHGTTSPRFASISDVSFIFADSTLQVGNGGTSGALTGDVVLQDGILAFNRSDTVTFAGNISDLPFLYHAACFNTAMYCVGFRVFDIPRGLGALQQNGSGTLILTGDTTLSGQSSVVAGSTLQIGNGGTSGTFAGQIVVNGRLVFNRSDDSTFSGSTIGYGTLEQVGIGRLILTGETIIYGSAIIANGSVMQIGNGGTTGLLDGEVIDNGTLVFDRSDDYFFNGDNVNGSISGTGSVQQIGGGTAVLFTQPTYTGGTLISAGALEFYNVTIPGDVVDNARLIYAGTSDPYSGTISGSGSVENAGFLTLTGANSYTGGTIVTSGIVQIGNGGTTGSIVGDVTFAPPFAFNDAELQFDRSDTVTFSGVISGYGSVWQNGSGTLKLTGTNTYSNFTFVAQGGTLQIGNGGTQGSIEGIVGDFGTLAFDRSDAVLFDGTIQGDGALAQIGGGTLVLTAENTYAGGTKIGVGSKLQIGDGAARGSIVGDVVDNGSLIFDHNTIFEFDGRISGSGGLRVTGGGTLFLTGVNSYTGGTVIDPGNTLQLGEGVLTTGRIVGNVVGNGTLKFLNFDVITFGGDISGAGSLMDVGYGQLILTGNNSFTGGTSIVGPGILQVGNGGTAGSLTGNVFDLGTLTFDRSDTFVFNGDISSQTVISPNVSGMLQQIGSGTLILNGVNTYTGLTSVSAGTLMVGDAGHPGARISGNVVVANGATLEGHGTILGSVSNISGGTVAPGGSIGTLTVASYTQGANSTLKIAVTPQANSMLVVTGAASLNGTLDFDFGPSPYGGIQSFNFLSAGSVSGRFSSVISTGAAGGLVYGLTYGATGVSMTIQPTSAGQIYSDALSATLDNAHALGAAIVDRGDACADATQSGCPQFTAWGFGFGGAGSASDRTGRAARYSTRQAGMVGGIDYHIAQDESVGIAVAVEQGALGVAGQVGRALDNSISIAVDGAAALLGGRLDADIQYSSTGTATHRDLGTIGIVTAHPDSLAAGGTVQFSYPLLGGDLTPLARLSFVHLNREASVETGVDDANLALSARDYDSMRTVIGARLRHSFVFGEDVVLIPEVSAGLQTELLSVERNVALHLAASGTEFGPPYAKPDWTVMTAGAGLTLQVDGDTAFILKGDGQFGGHQSEGIVSLGAHINL